MTRNNWRRFPKPHAHSQVVRAFQIGQLWFKMQYRLERPDTPSLMVEYRKEIGLISLLHVEDDQDIREIAEMALGLFAKFEVTQCADGFEALKTLETLVPDIILLDMMMPNMTGVQLLEKLRLIPHLQDVPVVFMTARVQATEVKALIDCGAVGVIVKPFDPITLSDQIEKFYDDNRNA